MTKLEKCSRRVNEAFRDKLHAAFMSKFSLQLETTFSIAAMSLVSYLPDEKPLTPEQRDFIVIYSDGYVSAMNQIHD